SLMARNRRSLSSRADGIGHPSLWWYPALPAGLRNSGRASHGSNGFALVIPGRSGSGEHPDRLIARPCPTGGEPAEAGPGTEDREPPRLQRAEVRGGVEDRGEAHPAP